MNLKKTINQVGYDYCQLLLLLLLLIIIKIIILKVSYTAYLTSIITNQMSVYFYNTRHTIC